MKQILNENLFNNEMRTGTDETTIARSFLDNLHYLQGTMLENASRNDLYMAFIL